MFGVPVEKNGVNGHLRQKGKIAELACGYGGSIGAIKAMGGTELKLTDDELYSLVDDWRRSSPNIVKFWSDVYDFISNLIQLIVKTRLPQTQIQVEGQFA